MSLKIYLASSWRNNEAVKIIFDCLRKLGFEVDCFCDQEGGRFGFNISEAFQTQGHNIYEIDAITAFQHPAIASKFIAAFAEDKKWLDWCNCLILLMPCGRSAHLEAGYVKGRGGLFYIYWLNEPIKGEFENMYQFADGLFCPEELYKLIDILKQQRGGNGK